MELWTPILGAFLYNLTLLAAVLTISAAITALFYGAAAIARWRHNRRIAR